MNWFDAVLRVAPVFAFYTLVVLAICAVSQLIVFLRDDEPYGWDMPFNVTDDRE